MSVPRVIRVALLIGTLLPHAVASVPYFVTKPGPVFVLENTMATLNWTMGLRGPDTSLPPGMTDLTKLVHLIWKFKGTLEHPTDDLLMTLTQNPEDFDIYSTKTNRLGYPRSPHGATLTLRHVNSGDNGDYEIIVVNASSPGQTLLNDTATLVMVKESEITFNISMDSKTWPLAVSDNGTQVTLPEYNVIAAVPSRLVLRFDIGQEVRIPHLVIHVTTPDGNMSVECDNDRRTCQRTIYLSINSERPENMLLFTMDFGIQNFGAIHLYVPIRFQLYQDFRLLTKPGRVFVPENSRATLNWTIGLKNNTEFSSVSDPTSLVHIGWRYLGTSQQPKYQDVLTYTPGKLHTWWVFDSSAVEYLNHPGSATLQLDNVSQQLSGDYQVTVVNNARPDQVLLTDVASLEVFKDIIYSVTVNEHDKQPWPLSLRDNGTNISLFLGKVNSLTTFGITVDVSKPEGLTADISIGHSLDSMRITRDTPEAEASQDDEENQQKIYRRITFMALNVKPVDLQITLVLDRLAQSVKDGNTEPVGSIVGITVGIVIGLIVIVVIVLLPKYLNYLKERKRQKPEWSTGKSTMGSDITNLAIGKKMDDESTIIVSCYRAEGKERCKVLDESGKERDNVLPEINHPGVVTMHPDSGDVVVLTQNERKADQWSMMLLLYKWEGNTWAEEPKVIHIDGIWYWFYCRVVWGSETEVILSLEDGDMNWWLLKYKLNNDGGKEIWNKQTDSSFTTDICVITNLVWACDTVSAKVYLFQLSDGEKICTLSIQHPDKAVMLPVSICSHRDVNKRFLVLYSKTGAGKNGLVSVWETDGNKSYFVQNILSQEVSNIWSGSQMEFSAEKLILSSKHQISAFSHVLQMMKEEPQEKKGCSAFLKRLYKRTPNQDESDNAGAANNPTFEFGQKEWSSEEMQHEITNFEVLHLSESVVSCHYRAEKTRRFLVTDKKGKRIDNLTIKTDHWPACSFAFAPSSGDMLVVCQGDPAADQCKINVKLCQLGDGFQVLQKEQIPLKGKWYWFFPRLVWIDDVEAVISVEVEASQWYLVKIKRSADTGELEQDTGQEQDKGRPERKSGRKSRDMEKGLGSSQEMKPLTSGNEVSETNSKKTNSEWTTDIGLVNDDIWLCDSIMECIRVVGKEKLDEERTIPIKHPDHFVTDPLSFCADETKPDRFYVLHSKHYGKNLGTVSLWLKKDGSNNYQYHCNVLRDVGEIWKGSQIRLLRIKNEREPQTLLVVSSKKRLHAYPVPPV